MVHIAVATGPRFGGLDQVIDAFPDRIRPMTLSILQDAGPAGLDSCGGLTNGTEAAMGGPKIPMAQEGFGRFGRLIPEFLERFFDGISVSRFEMGLAQLRERVDGLGFQILGIFEPQI